MQRRVVGFTPCACLAPPRSEAAHGGQVIVSEKAWAAVQDQLPGQPHVGRAAAHVP
jgi:hypothetical protein